MKIDVFHRPAHALARVRLDEGESIVAESGAMVGMSTNVSMETSAGGVVAGIKRMLGGESFFRNTFTAHHGIGEVLLAHGLPGDIVTLPLAPEHELVVSQGAYVAATKNVAVDTRGASLRGMMAGEGLFLLRARVEAGETGTILLGAFGGVQELACEDGLVVDTGHLVAWDASVSYRVTKSASGWLSSWLSGEGLACTFTGHGRIWIQSRSPRDYGNDVGPRLPARTS